MADRNTTKTPAINQKIIGSGAFTAQLYTLAPTDWQQARMTVEISENAVAGKRRLRDLLLKGSFQPFLQQNTGSVHAGLTEWHGIPVYEAALIEVPRIIHADKISSASIAKEQIPHFLKMLGLPKDLGGQAGLLVDLEYNPKQNKFSIHLESLDNRGFKFTAEHLRLLAKGTAAIDEIPSELKGAIEKHFKSTAKKLMSATPTAESVMAAVNDRLGAIKVGAVGIVAVAIPSTVAAGTRAMVEAPEGDRAAAAATAVMQAVSVQLMGGDAATDSCQKFGRQAGLVGGVAGALVASPTIVGSVVVGVTGALLAENLGRGGCQIARVAAEAISAGISRAEDVRYASSPSRHLGAGNGKSTQR